MIKNKWIHFIPAIFLSCGEKKEVQDDAIEGYSILTFMVNDSFLRRFNSISIHA